MILGANQPYFLPYIGYWQLIHASDLFLIGDDYSYRKRSWISRNRILVQGKPVYFGIEIRKADSFRLCSELCREPIDRRKKLEDLRHAYHRAPHYEEGIRLMEEILSCKEEILSEYLMCSIRTICGWLGINTPIGKTSDLEGNSRFRLEERIYDMCRRTGADTYINPIGGTALYDFRAFREQGITLKFLQPSGIVYKQFQNDFVGSLSILDVIMFNSREEIRGMLDQYTLVTESGEEHFL